MMPSRRSPARTPLRFGPFATAVARLLIVAAITGWVPAASVAQTVDPNFCGTNGVVNTQVVVGNTLYIGGSFSAVGKPTGGFATVNGVTGAATGAFPAVAGTVNAIVSDGAGGWFVGGQFNTVGGQARANLAHVLSDNTVGVWNPGASFTVTSLALDGSTLYVAGLFNNVGGSARAGLASIDAGTGAVGAWDPGAVGQVTAIAVAGGTVYVGGAFTSVGGQPRASIAALDAVSGLATAWNPGANGNVFALVPAGGVIYAGGAFTTTGGQTRNRIAALDATSGLATAWNPNASGGTGQVRALAVQGGIVYAGGAFTTIGGQTRNRIAALDAVSGLATAWNPDANSEVRAILVDGSNVYAAGLYTFVGGQQRNRAAALDATSGLATAWNPDCSSSALAIAKSGSTIALGGSFTGLAFAPRSSLAAIDLTTGQATGWNPGGVNGPVQSMASDGSSLYVGGGFTIVGSVTRNRIAEVDLFSGIPTAWDPNVTGTSIAAMALEGSKLYVGGNFTAIGGQPRTRIAELDRGTGAPTAWNPVANSNVNALAVGSGVVYATGFFSTIGGQTRVGVAALDRATGLATAWNPNPAGGTCASVAVGNGVVYVGGAFSSIGGQPYPGVAAIDATTGLATSWNAGVAGGGNITAVRVSSSAVYIGGLISQVGTEVRRGIAALDPGTGAVLNWCPTGTAGTGNVNSLVLSGSSVFAGGSFLSMEGVPSGFVAKIEAVPAVTYGLTIATDPIVGGSVSRSPSESSYEAGISVTLEATPSGGYHFVGWSGDLLGSANPQNLVMNGSKAVTAHFAVNSYTLTIQSSGGGTVTKNPDQPTYAHGSLVQLTAVPEPNHAFTSWGDAISGSTNPVTIIMDANKSVDANFHVSAYTITTTTTAGGQISPGGAVAVPVATDQTFQIIPDFGYRVDRVIVDGEDLGDPVETYTFEHVEGDHTLQAFFSRNVYTITASRGPNGTISPLGTVNVSFESDKTFTMSPATGYHVADVLVDGVSVGAPSSYTFASIDSSHTISVSFARNVYTILASAGPGGTIGPDDTLSVLYEDTPTFTITPAPDHYLDYVLVDGVWVGPAAAYTFSPVAANHSITAHFASIHCLAFRDEFEQVLEPGWGIVRENPASWSIVDEGLRIELDHGDLWQYWTNNSRNLFVRTAPPGDFTIEARLDVDLVANINQAHIVLYADDENYLRFGPVRIGSDLILDHVYEVGAGIAQQFGAFYPSNQAYLRVRRVGSSATMEYSQDGTAWTSLTSIASLAFVPRFVGLVAFDGSEPTSASVATFDYFSLTGEAQATAVGGTVTATCNTVTSALAGVTVDLFTTDEEGVDVLVGSTATDESGAYAFPSVTPGAYMASIVAPLGYHTATPTRVVGGCGDGAGAGDFALTCIPITAQPRAMGYWKHQVNVYLSGKGQAQETLAALVNYINLIVQHFNQNIVNPVIVYVPGATSTNDQLLQLQQLLTLNKGATHLDRAKQQLLSLLLNVVSGKIHQTHVISSNGATVSQAITYCYDLIVDGDASTDVTAKSIAEYINDGQQVPSGMVPIGTRVITYDPQAPLQQETPLAFGIHQMPNPARGGFAVTLGLVAGEPARLELIDIAGRRVWRREVTGLGRLSVRVGDGVSLASGVYRVRLVQAGQVATRTVVVTR